MSAPREPAPPPPHATSAASTISGDAFSLIPDTCCHDYVQYVAECGPGEPGRLLRVGKHLLAHSGRCSTVAFLATRKKRDGVWVQGFRAVRLTVPLADLEGEKGPDLDYIASLLAPTSLRELPDASLPDVYTATRLPSQCAYDFQYRIVRATRAYRAFSGECALCYAMVGPNLLAAAEWVEEEQAARAEREEALRWAFVHRPDVMCRRAMLGRERS